MPVAPVGGHAAWRRRTARVGARNSEGTHQVSDPRPGTHRRGRGRGRRRPARARALRSTEREGPRSAGASRFLARPSTRHGARPARGGGGTERAASAARSAAPPRGTGSRSDTGHGARDTAYGARGHGGTGLRAWSRTGVARCRGGAARGPRRDGARCAERREHTSVRSRQWRTRGTARWDARMEAGRPWRRCGRAPRPGPAAPSGTPRGTRRPAGTRGARPERSRGA